jgi:hypothetical protein
MYLPDLSVRSIRNTKYLVSISKRCKKHPKETQMYTNNVIYVDSPTWYSMRQIRETLKYLKPLVVKKPVYATEIKGEEEIYNLYMKQILKRAA